MSPLRVAAGECGDGALCPVCLINSALEESTAPGTLRPEHGGSAVIELTVQPKQIGPYTIIEIIGRGRHGRGVARGAVGSRAAARSRSSIERGSGQRVDRCSRAFKRNATSSRSWTIPTSRWCTTLE